MKRTDLVIISLRLLAVYLLVMGLASLPAAVVSFISLLDFADPDSTVFLVSTSFNGFGYLLACLALWWLSPRIARLVEKGLPPDEAPETEFTPPVVLSIGLVLLGFLILSWAIPSLVRIAVALLLPSLDTHYVKTLATMGGAPRSLVPWSDILSTLVRMAFGTWLVVGSRGIAAFLKKVRYADRPMA